MRSGLHGMPQNQLYRFRRFFGVCGLIHQNDFLITFLLTINEERRRLRRLGFNRSAMTSPRPTLASGYCMATRYLNNYLPVFDMTSRDIHESAFECISKGIGSRAILSKTDSEDLFLDRPMLFL